MPATLTIKSTRTGGKAIDYSSAHNGKDKAHNNNKMKRVLAASGVNCTPETGKQLMQAIWRKKRTKERNLIEAYTVVQSFDPKNFDFKNPDDIKLANKMGQELVQKVVPTRLALIYTQADGTHNVIHNHIIVCSIDDATMKAMRGDQKQFKTWANANDRVLKEHGYETLKEITSHYAKSKEKINRAEIGASESREIEDAYGNKMVQSGTVTRTEKIKERIESLLADPNVNSWKSFQEKAKNADLDVKIRYNKQGKINGLSYKLLDDPQMKRGIRAKRLGSNYMKENLNDVFRQNIKKLNDQKIERSKTRKLEADRKQREIEQQQRAARQRAELARQKTRRHLLDVGENVEQPSILTIVAQSTKRASLDVESEHQQTTSPTKQPEQSVDDGLSIFDDYNSALRKNITDSNNNASGNHDGSKAPSTVDELIKQLQEQQQLESSKRKQLNRQLARNIDFIVFSRKRASKLRRWIEKYYRKSIRFVERHFSASSNLVRKLDISVKGTSDKLDESTIHHRNGNKQLRSTTKDNSISSASNNRHAKIDSDLDPASKLSTNQFDKDNQIDDDDIPF
ncbi:relaxase/mobilization nuclease domain-containing protein [Lactobacillus gallinarum]|uniref:relaxase/mobilization nuclease domain-containing protein n=1 Tax=Lactobacillus gallinarum TaxID=52242 RepID=UPI0025A450F6|nr:relaxase/mobilization nuclease domain-containing protein [Lactobacillus gallinarum]MDM8281845.1 relaxase/mobilization nuclease domain-containing protein [Lactobacillus gallinarum]